MAAPFSSICLCGPGTPEVNFSNPINVDVRKPGKGTASEAASIYKEVAATYMLDSDPQKAWWVRAGITVALAESCRSLSGGMSSKRSERLAGGHIFLQEGADRS